MKMPEKMDKAMLSICGMNCSACYKHLIVRKYVKACDGCKSNNGTSPKHCRECKIKECATLKNIDYCFQCEEYPCKVIKNLDKSYKMRYQTSLIENGLYIKENGIDKFFEEEVKRWSCPNCNGVISLHDKFCSECLKPSE